jgi:hypothetical protein
VKVRFVADDRALVAQPAIGATVVLAVPSMRVLWRGTADDISFERDGSVRLIERSPKDDKATLVTVAPGPKIVRAPNEERVDPRNIPFADDPIADLSRELVQRLAPNFCRVGEWLLPPLACDDERHHR